MTISWSRGQYKRAPMESALPHEIVNKMGKRVPVGSFKSKGAATRELHRRIKEFDKRLRGTEDPRNWKVQPIREVEE